MPTFLHAATLSLALVGSLTLVSCGGGDAVEPATDTANASSVTAGEGVRTARALGLSSAEAARAQWSAVYGLSLVPAAAAVLPSGKVLLWAADGRTTFGGGSGHTYTTIFDPVTGTAAERDVSNTGHDMFCPGTSLLPDGRLLVNGGIDSPRTSLYDPAANAWTTAAAMNIPRAYNSSVPLADGSVLTLGGSWADRSGGKTAEVYTPAGGWRVLSGSPYDPFLLDGTFRDWQSDSHAAAFPTANGRVLVAGPSPNMGWIDTRGNGTNLAAGRRGDDQPAFAGTYAMYDAGKILKAGGATWNSGVSASAASYLIDTTQGAASVRKLQPMAYPRVYANSVVLPNGQVVVVGGQTYAIEFSDANAVLAPELWDPETERFVALPAMSVPRNYHGVSLLLPDGRVMAAGGGLSGGAGDHPDLQILSPPYLFNADGTAATRPVITAAPASVGYGTRMAVTTNTVVSAFSMVRIGASTHTVNNDQRRVALKFTLQGDGSYQVDVPTNPGILLPGNWMLFALNAQGTPSLAKIVQVSRNGTPTLENPGNLDVLLGGTVSLPVTASTPSGSLSFSAEGLPAGISIHPTTGSLSGSAQAAGSYLVTLKATNGSQTVSTDMVINVTAAGSGTGLLGQYFSGTGMGGTPVVQRVEVPDFDWGIAAPATGVPADSFSTRWSGWIEAVASGPTQIRTISDDGVRLWIDGVLVVDNWGSHAATIDSASVTLVAGQRYRIQMEHYDGGGSAVARLQWMPAGASGFVTVPASRLYTAATPLQSNLAAGRSATQSSTYGSYISGLAVDGNTNGGFGSGSVTHTNNDAQAWWQVDLGSLRRVDLVHLWNRTDCCTDRLQNLVVFVSATDMTGRSLDQLNADATVIRRAVGVSQVVPGIGVPINGAGRYVRVQLTGTNVLSLAEVQVFGGPATFGVPTISSPGDQQSEVETTVSLAVSATDPDGYPLNFQATGLPPGVAINASTGRISGTPSTAGRYTVTVSAANDGGQSASTTFSWTVLDRFPSVEAIPATITAAGSSVLFSPTVGSGAALQFSWNFGDGTADTAWSSSASASHTYAQPGVYSVTLSMRTADGRTTSQRFVQAITAGSFPAAARSSSPLLLEPRSGAAARLWVANPDHDSVSVLDTSTGGRVAEIRVGSAPRTLARADDGRIWVANQRSGSISIINPSTLAVAQTVALPRASQPFGLVFSSAESAAFVALEATGQVIKLHGSTGATLAVAGVGTGPRHLSLTGAGDRLLVSRFITRALPGESTATVTTLGAGGEVVELNPGTLATVRVIVLGHSDRADSEAQGRGIPNYLGAAVIAPDGRSAWVPSKQDNLLRGSLRSGQNLDFQNTVRAVSSRIDMAASTEVLAARIDHDNASVASAAAFHPTGAYLFVALETSRQVAVVDAAGQRELFRFEVGLAPQAVLVSSDGLTLYTHNFMSRSVSATDLRPLVQRGQIGAASVATWATVGTERLTAQVLLGKQLFYDARDTRLARDSYMSCAACHNDGGHDGRVWDLTGFGEGLRNTISLRGRAGTGHGFLHWSANFDEVQDFEKQIRELAGGSGLMTDAQFSSSTRSQPLGDRKTGVSSDLDALAAYVASLAAFEPSPYRDAAGNLTPAAVAGAQVFKDANCTTCHKGADFTSSGDGSGLRDVGTLKPSTGRRLGATLSGIDVPTLRDVWATGPYLHDGSAATLGDAVQAHAGVALSTESLNNLVAYLQQIGSEEQGPGGVLLSQGKTATQSSTASGGVASRAVDGNTGGIFGSGSVTHTNSETQPWWQVDLGSSAAVDKVSLWNRTDCCSDRLQDVYVLLSANDMTGRSLGQLTADAGVTVRRLSSLSGAASAAVDFGGMPGRYVRVQLGGTNVLSLAEVQVYGTALTLRQLAQGKPASQSSTNSGGLASRAVDGNTNGAFSAGSVTHTNSEAQAWWQVDLQASAGIRQVSVWNRTDCCSDRLANFVVLLSDTDMTGRTLAQLQADPSITSRQVTGLNGASVVTLAWVQARARYVRIQLVGTGILSLAELQVAGP